MQPNDATPKQKVLITRLAMALGIREPIETLPMSKGVAGWTIRYMLAEVKANGLPIVKHQRTQR